MSVEIEENTKENRAPALTQKTEAVSTPNPTTVKNSATPTGIPDKINSPDVCNHKTAENIVANMEKKRSIWRSQQKEVERKMKAKKLQQRDILGRRQVEVARIETVDHNRRGIFHKKSFFETELNKLLSDQQEQHKKYDELGKLLEECKEKIATKRVEKQAADQISRAREKDLKIKEIRLKELTSTIRALNTSIVEVEDKISKKQSKTLRLKQQREILVLRIARTKNSSTSRSSRALAQLEDKRITYEGDIQVETAASKELITHHMSLVEERKSQERKHHDLLETVMSIKNILRDSQKRYNNLTQNLLITERQLINFQDKQNSQQTVLERYKDEVEKKSGDLEAVKSAYEQLTHRKSTIRAVLKNILTEENQVKMQIKALQKKNRSLSDKIGKISQKREQLDNQGLSDFKDCTARVLRHDASKKCQGTLIVSRSDLKFLPSYRTRDNLYHLSMPLTHVLAAQLNNLRNVPELTITLDPDIETYSSHELRFTKEPKRLRKICEFLNSRYTDKSKVETREVKQQSLQNIEPEIIGESSILNVTTFKKLILKCPKQVMFFPWKRLWSLEKNGSSMYAFYERLKGCQFTMLLIEDASHAVFGAYLCEEWHTSNKPYGKFETFVFRENDGDVEVWNATTDEYFYQFSDENIFVGVKDRSAIWLSSNFQTGKTSPCPTFTSPPLIKNSEDTVYFQVLVLEIWAPSYDF